MFYVHKFFPCMQILRVSRRGKITFGRMDVRL
jgi:hypothetical protein